MSSSTFAAQRSGAGTSTMRIAGEKRRSTRAPHVVDAWICSPTAVDPVEEREEVRSLNMSRHGLAFSSSRALVAGAFWMIEIGIGDQRIVSEIRIMNCRRGEDGLWDVGAEFC